MARRRKNKNKKLEPGPEPSPSPTPTPTPTPTPEPKPKPPEPEEGKDVFGIKQIYPSKQDGDLWESLEWHNSQPRTFGRHGKTCVADPADARLRVAGATNPQVTCDGKGVLKAGTEAGKTGTTRIVAMGSWQNVEQTVYFRFPSDKPSDNCDMRCKTQHYCVDTCNGDLGCFGGYLGNFSRNDSIIHLRKEETHSTGYGPRVGQVPQTFQPDKWYGGKVICYNLPGNKVKVEAWLDETEGKDGGNWIKKSEGTDDGNWKGAPVTKAVEGSAIRTNSGAVPESYVEYKWMSAREIQIQP